MLALAFDFVLRLARARLIDEVGRARIRVERADDPMREIYGLAIFAEPDDYGLLCPAVVTDEPDDAAPSAATPMT